MNRRWGKLPQPLSTRASHFGILHRDIKPANVFLVEQDGNSDFVKIVDFGIAKVLASGVQVPSPLAVAQSATPVRPTASSSGEASAVDPRGGHLTIPGTVMGTPPYMSPEQTQGEQIDARTDQYAFGCMFYQMLTGRTPYIGQTAIEIMLQHTDPSKHPIPPRQLMPQLQLSDTLEQTILRLLAKPPGERFPSMAEVEQALDRELDLLLLARGDRRLLTAEQAQVLTGKISGAALIVGGRRMTLWALIPVLCVFVIVAVGVGYRLMSSHRVERPRLQPGELGRLRERALATLRRNLAPTASQELRLAALQALGQSRDGSLSKEIEPLLQDGDPLIQTLAAEALGQLADPGALPALQAGLKKSALPAVKVALAGALRQLHEPSGQRQLTEALRSQNPVVQFDAAMFLCDDSSVPQAQQLLRSYMDLEETPEQARQSILACLAQSGDPHARQKLGEYARGRGPERLNAAGRLLQLGDEGVRDLLHLTLRQGGFDALVAARLLSGPDEVTSVQKLLDVAPDKSADPLWRRLAAEGLGESGNAFHARLLGQLLEPAEDAQLRNTAAASIVRLAAQDPETLTGNSLRWAQSALTNRDWLLRQAAVSVLGDAASPDAVPLLAQAVKDSDIRVRRSALQALGHRREASALLVLRDNLAIKDDQLRSDTIHALGQILGAPALPGEQSGRAEATQWLRTYFDRATPSEQAQVSEILAALGDKTHRAKLNALAVSPDPELRRSFAASPVASADDLGRALADPVFAVRLAAAKQLARQGNHRAADVLREAVKLGGADAVTAYGLLFKLGEAPGEPAELSQILAAPEVSKRVAAVGALSTLPPEIALPLLLKAAHDPEARVRSRVVAVSSGLPTKDGTAVGTPIWQLLLTDRDGAVRARAQVLLARSAGSPAPVAETELVEEPTAKSDMNPTEPAVTDLGPGAQPAELPGPGETPTNPEPSLAEPAMIELAKPELVKPELAKPELAKPELTKPEPTKPESEAEPEAEAETDSVPETEPVASAQEGAATLTIEAEPGILYQLDHRPWQVTGPQPIALTPGPHHLGALSGPQDFTAVAQKTVTVHLEVSRIERLSRAALEFSRHANYRRAQRMLEQALSSCSQDRKNAAPCAVLVPDMTFRLGQLRARQNEYPEAMTEYQKVTTLLRKGKGKPELRAQVEKAMRALRGYVCKVVIHQRVGLRCIEETAWVGPGPRTLKVGTHQEQFEAQAGGELPLGSCK